MDTNSSALDGAALEAAAAAIANRLGAEAFAQRAYLHSHADGHVSMELEWIDLAELARDAITAYLAAFSALKAYEG